jgi:CRP-like cAMP-binding protein
MSSDPRLNRLLAALPHAEYERLAPQLELTTLELGVQLYCPGETLEHIYFPTDSIISLLHALANGSTAEIAVVGNDGLFGISLFMGGISTSIQAVVQSGGHAYRLNAEAVNHEFILGGAVQSLFLRYTQALMTQMTQTSVCNRHHSLDQQLCRWLLLSLDRLPSNEIRMTHQLISNMLGVRREGVSVAAGRLQEAGLINYARGTITVLDRPGLEARVCECYAVVRKNRIDCSINPLRDKQEGGGNHYPPRLVSGL